MRAAAVVLVGPALEAAAVPGLHHDLRADALPAPVLDLLVEGGLDALLHRLAFRRGHAGVGELRLAAAPAQDDGREQEGDGELALQLGPGDAVADRPQHVAPGPDRTRTRPNYSH